VRPFNSQPLRRQNLACAIGYRSSAWGGAAFFFELPAADPAACSRDDSGGHRNPHR
jgi:hypothetical protein